MESEIQTGSPSPGKSSGARNKETRRSERKSQRRKIALACEPCRERKSRCDGEKPICGSCHHRGFSLEQCVYKVDNARSASNDAYIKVLHNRIRELEQACIKSGATIPDLGPELAVSDDVQSTHQFALESNSQYARGSLNPIADESNTRVDRNLIPSPTILVEGASNPGEKHGQPGVTSPIATASNRLPTAGRVPEVIIRDSSGVEGAPRDGTSSGPCAGLSDNIRSLTENPVAQNTQSSNIRADLRGDYPPQPLSEDPDSLSSPNAQGPVTAMGAISVVNEEEKESAPRKDYFGSSSAASFMRLARESVSLPSQPRRDVQNINQCGKGTINSHNTEPTWREFCKPAAQLQYEHFSLPPRPLADYLLQCYLDRVYWLYPFFHRPSFEIAYEDLWIPFNQTKRVLPKPNIGLGSSQDSGKYCRVFYCALNAIFALGCHFSDIPPTDREAVAHSFFLRSKQFVGQEILEISTIGVVQTFLISALYLQSTPYPNRCWNSIGVACRVAQGIGLHTEAGQDHVEPLEREIRRRTWHGCVMMDLVVSMTLGRPSMTSHLPTIPLPSTLSDHDLINGRSFDRQSVNAHSHVVFYVCTIELYKILDDIMSEVYMAWRNGTGGNASITGGRAKQAGLDVIIDIDSKLCNYETSLPAFLSWTGGRQVPEGLNEMETAMYECQTNVLHARYLHLRLLLHRPIFTQLWAAKGGSSKPDSSRGDFSHLGSNMLYSSFVVKCATACIIAAIDLVELIHSNYLTPATSAWWYNGLYISTAGIVLIMSRSCPSTLDQIEVSKIDEAWIKCEEILSNMASFSISGRNTLKVLQSMYSQKNPDKTSHEATSQPTNPQRKTPNQNPSFNHGDNLSQTLGEQVNPFETEMGWQGGSFMDWDGAMNYGADEFGLFMPFDVPGSSSWFPDMPG